MIPKIRIVNDMPPEAYNDELVGIDLEIYKIPQGKVHRPVGIFACISICMERELDGRDEVIVYQTYDPHELPSIVDRIKRGRWVFQNGQFDIRQMRRWCTVEPRMIWDTMVIEQGLFGGYYSSFDLASLSLRYLLHPMSKAEREEFQTADEMTPEMRSYAAQDPVVTLMVAMAQMDYVDQEDVSLTHYWMADLPNLWAILDMPPVRLDVVGWQKLSEDFKSKADAVQARYEINLGSTQQVNKVLTDMMGRKRALSSTDEETLTELIGVAEQGGKTDVVTMCNDVLEYRGCSKMSGTYGMNWIEKYVEDEDLIYADWRNVEARSGRMACRTPALQTIPSRAYPEFRTMFVASPNHRLIVADVAGQEPRVLAKLSGDKFLTGALMRGESPHVAVGKEIFKDPNFSKADPRYKTAKEANLGTSYGMTASGLARRTGIPEDEAEEFLKHYFKTMPGIRTYIDSYRKVAYRQGYVSTLLGRRNWINPHSHKWQNNAINGPIQGTAADMTKVAVGVIHKESKLRNMPFCLTMVIHDETVCDVPDGIVPEYRELIEEAWREAGRKTIGNDIPVVVDMADGKDWSCKK